MSNSVVVIGSNSFSGAYFCRYLLDKGEEVIGISRSHEPVEALLPHRWSKLGKIQFHQLDLNHDIEDIDQLLNRYQPGYVYNFAAQSMVGQSWEFPEHWFQTNTVAFSKLINRLKDKDFLNRYVHVSTPEVYGSTSGFIDESQGFKPSTPYAISRVTGDHIVNAYYQSFGFPVVTTRAANVYGPGQSLYRIIPKTILSILKGSKLPLHGGGLSRRSFIHMDDVSEATYAIAKNGTCGESYHISTTHIVSIRELVEMICATLNVDFKAQVEITDDRIGKDDAYLLNATKLINQLGWQPKVELAKGVEQTIRWVKDNFDCLSGLPMNYIHKE